MIKKIKHNIWWEWKTVYNQNLKNGCDIGVVLGLFVCSNSILIHRNSEQWLPIYGAKID